MDKMNILGGTALIHAGAFGHHECALALIDAGAAVDKVDDCVKTALMFACEKGHHECAQALIDAHADLEPTDRNGHNALMITCESPHSDRPPSWSCFRWRPGQVKCALALLAATAPIREADFRDPAADL